MIELIIYCVFSYIFMLPVVIVDYKSGDKYTFCMCFSAWLFSPLTMAFILGLKASR